MRNNLDGYRYERSSKNRSPFSPALKTKSLPPLPYKMLVPDLDPTAPMVLTEKAGTFVSKGGIYRVQRIPNCGHWVLLEYPEVAAKSIMTWLEEDVLPLQESLLTTIKNKL